jgi:hypothetical protein
MPKLLPLVLVALLVPGIALAGGKPPKPGKSAPSGSSKAAPTVTYVLAGNLKAYQPANGAQDGSVTIAVKSTNNQARALRGQQVQIPVSTATRILGKLRPNDNVIVKARAPKSTTAAAMLAALLAAKAWQVIDQGGPHK